MTRPLLPNSILAQRVIPVARGLSADSAPPIAEALVAGGLSTIELTVEGDGGIAAIGSIIDREMTVGAGTVTSLEQAKKAFAAGASFLVSPHFDETVVAWAISNDIPIVPGALTPTEILRAWAYDVPAVKVFPASVGGPDYMKSLMGPYPDLALIPTGGVDAENAGDYMSSGAAAIGVGGWLTNHEDYVTITERARLLVERVV